MDTVLPEKKENFPIRKQNYSPPYSIGDAPHGIKISIIFEQRNGILIYLGVNGTLVWEIENEALNDNKRVGLVKCRELQGMIETSISKDCFIEAEMMLGNALTNAMASSSKKEIISYFEKVSKFVESHKIKYTVVKEPEFEIYLTQDNNVHFCHRNPESYHSAITEFQKLRNLADSLLPKSQLRHISNKLAIALRAAFRTESNDWQSNFKIIEDYIVNMSMIHTRSQYLLYSLLVGALTIVMTGCLYLYINSSFVSSIITLSPQIVEDMRNIILGGVAGSFGALISILQRSWNMELDTGIPRLSLLFQASTRIFLGLIFGGIIIITAKSDLALGFINKNIYSMIVFAIISGFSERFVPDLMEKIAKKEIDTIEKEGNSNL